ncbi:N-6 DNA methylase [Micromonospora sagamiensis]|uniref:N-6 DNA methylase n=1 Tax=Micromonospora sagamiensis TaxID=47875 RepID=A0A562WKS7_9ACTN|nr:N-6 DNA methylase [Micromonospora sagamiensis]TWJ30900.1 N-6 DNA methylase [Micromonospora sagamiensis]BCL16061.1 type II restriction endonuclease subunit M [Micromonospora sagamiensis]
MPQSALVTAAEISRLAGVTRATVSNWRRRHPDFPAPTGGTEASPAYDLAAVRTWLANRGQLPDSSPADELRTALRAAEADHAARTRLLPLVLAASRLPEEARRTLAELPDHRLPAGAREAARPCAGQLPDIGEPTYRADEVPLLRALLRCVAQAGALPTLDVLAEGTVDDTSTSGAYLTPAPVAELMAGLLAEPGEAYPEQVLDPACGAGGLLAAAATRGARELSGQDLAPAQAAQAAVRLLLLAGDATVRVRVGDSLRDDGYPSVTADAVLCAPPYGQRDWGHDDLAYDSRWVFGLPPKGESELAWLQHCLARLAPGRRAVLLLPPATAERPSGRRIRAEMLRHGALRAVVALPAGVAPPLHVGLHVWLLQRPHPQAATPGHVLFVDTAAPPEPHRAGEPESRRPTVSDWSAVRATALAAWADFDRHPDAFDPIPGTARAVAVIDLLDEAVDLTPARHVRTPVPVRPDELAEAAYGLRRRLRRAVSGLSALSGGGDWPPAGATARTWRTATVADLLRGEALTLLRAPAATRGPQPADRDTATPRTLTARDVLAHRPASGAADDDPAGAEVPIEVGDVVLPELLHHGGGTARVADARDAGLFLGRHLYLLRPDPARLDPWFLAGFLAAEDNLTAASSGTSVIRVDPRRLRVPLLPLAEQQRYGRAFRQLNAVRVAADLANRLAGETARTLAAGLTGGALLPPDSPVEGTR